MDLKLSLKLFGPNNTLLFHVGIIIGNTNRVGMQFDLRQAKKGKYTMVATDTAVPLNQLTVTFYVDNDLFGTDVFGIIKVPFRANVYPPTSTAFPQFTFTFQPRRVKWRYYAVVRNAGGLSGAVLSVKDSATVYSFVQEGASPHAIIKVNGFDTVVFTSTAYIPFTESARTTFQLEKQTTPPLTAPLMYGLNNPKKDGVDSDRYGQLTNAMVLEKHIAEMFVFVDSLTLA